MPETYKLARCRCAEDSYRGPATSAKPHTDPATCPAYATCAECAAPMYGRVRVHHHTENGRDVT